VSFGVPAMRDPCASSFLLSSPAFLLSHATNSYQSVDFLNHTSATAEALDEVEVLEKVNGHP